MHFSFNTDTRKCGIYIKSIIKWVLAYFLPFSPFLPSSSHPSISCESATRLSLTVVQFRAGCWTLVHGAGGWWASRAFSFPIINFQFNSLLQDCLLKALQLYPVPSFSQGDDLIRRTCCFPNKIISLMFLLSVVRLSAQRASHEQS